MLHASDKHKNKDRGISDHRYSGNNEEVNSLDINSGTTQSVNSNLNSSVSQNGANIVPKQQENIFRSFN